MLMPVLQLVSLLEKTDANKYQIQQGWPICSNYPLIVRSYHNLHK